MNKINNTQKIILFIFSILFFINPVLGNFNITFQSDNEKVINIFDIDNNSYQISSNTTNQITNLPYNNYNIKHYPSNTRITNNNGSFILNNISSFNSDWQLALWFGVILFFIYLGGRVFRNIL